jgi:hypothetical protein
MDIESGKDSSILLKEEYKQLSCYVYCLSILYFIVSIPFIFINLYIGFSGNKCLIEHPSYLMFDLKTYLIGDGFIKLIIIIIKIYLLLKIVRIHENELDEYKLNKFEIVEIMYYIVWSTLGGILIWKHNTCNEMITNYINIKLFFQIIYVVKQLSNISKN